MHADVNERVVVATGNKRGQARFGYEAEALGKPKHQSSQTTA